MTRPSWLRNWHIVLAALLVIVAGAVLWAVFGEWQWGVVPEWLAAIGTVGTLSFVGWSWNNDRQLRRDESQQSQARLFDGWVQRVRSEGSTRVYEVRLSNASHQAIRSVDVSLEVMGVRLDRGYHLGVVPPNASGVVCEAEITESPGPYSPLLGSDMDMVQGAAAVALSFVDASGLLWARTGKGELKIQYDTKNPPKYPPHKRAG